MEIEIRLFAMFREYLPDITKGFSFKKEVLDGTKVSDLIEGLNLPPDIPKMVIIDAHIVNDDYLLNNGDVVSIFPPISGG